MKTNIVFHKLEEADGYPHFNERFFEQNMNSIQFAIKDPYKEQFEKLKQTATNEMTELHIREEKLCAHDDNVL